ncbi:ABC transporter substrate-binding protein [Anaerococcus octavius]|uniref:ABC-type taurine transport system, periplasmic component n=1 Tax=Anaerococcus octavius TaxID=54007 RepID=A0A2I1M3T6_9FIRM|nr:ABC transporter substrate-binding protein [Anaerococcus octavius]PKZ14774.1 myristoyl transferase [Anaerococcus octavius]SUU91951.1 ABC-type taurine transport system, periplasmic component [Anaerococcus octavius]
MNNFKKIALTLAMALSFTACVNDNQETKKDDTQAEMPAGDEKTDTSAENVNDKDSQTVEKEADKEANDNKDEDNDVETTGKMEDEPHYGEPIKVAYNGGVCTGAPGIADVRGEFKKRGLEVEFVNVESDVDSIGTHTADATVGHIAKFVPPTINGVDMVFASGAHTGCKSLYVLDNGEINDTEGLKGKTVGFPGSIGSADHNIAIRFFDKDGIKPDEVNYKQVEMSAIVQSMESGELAGAILSDEYADKFVQDGTIKMIRSLSFDDDFKDEACCVNALNGDFVRENPLMAKAYNEAVLSTQKWMEDNVEDAAKILFDNNWASGDFDTVVKMMDSYNWAVSLDETEDTLEGVVDDYRKLGIIDSDVKTEDFISNYWNSLGLKDSDIK